jgi:hypothetical protein
VIIFIFVIVRVKKKKGDVLKRLYLCDEVCPASVPVLGSTGPQHGTRLPRPLPNNLALPTHQPPQLQLLPRSLPKLCRRGLDPIQLRRPGSAEEPNLLPAAGDHERGVRGLRAAVLRDLRLPLPQVRRRLRSRWRYVRTHARLSLRLNLLPPAASISRSDLALSFPLFPFYYQRRRRSRSCPRSRPTCRSRNRW